MSSGHLDSGADAVIANAAKVAAKADPTIKRGTCPICGMGCFVEAKIVDNKPLSVKPDKASPHPADCPRAGQAIDYHDHPDRLNYPMKRVGKRGEGKWERISWDQALEEIATKLAAIRDKHGPEALQVMGGSFKGPGDAASWRFCNLFGTPNMMHQGKNCGEAEFLAEWSTYGNKSSLGHQPTPGVTKCVVYWGSNQPIAMGTKVRKIMAEVRKQGGTVIAIDPRRTETTEMADLWLQLRPGTDGALAYGMLNVIIREGIYDKAFVEKWCTGFDELAKVVEKYTPELVSEITWVPADKIIEAARIYATNSPALLTFGLGAVELGKGTTSAVFGKAYLRAITGNLDVPGGQKMDEMPNNTRYREEMFWEKNLEHPLRTRDNVSADIWPINSVRAMKAFRKAMEKVNPLGPGAAFYIMCTAPHGIWNAILEEKPYPVKALITQGTNAMVALANSRRIHDALMSDNLELSINMDHWLTPGGQLADYLLPATDGLERSLLGNMWGFGNTQEAAHRLIEPLYERRDDYQLWRELGNRLGQEGYWPDTIEGWFDRILEPSGITHAQLADQDLPWMFGEPEFMRHEKNGFGTTSGKVELASSLMQGLGYPAIPDYEEPHWSPVSTPELFKDFPFVMTTGGGLKWYYRSQHKQLEQMRKQQNYAEVTIHPDTAAELGIAKGDMVYVETPMGRVRQRAIFSDALHPRVIHADGNWWYPEQEQTSPNLMGVWESNINSILSDAPEHADFAGDCHFRGLMCNVYPVGQEQLAAAE